MKKFENLPYGEQPENRLDLYLPEEDGFDLFVYFHGGGLEGGAKENDRVLFEYLAERGIASASVEYRMYPEAKYPDFIVDAAASVAYMKAHIGEYGSCRRIFVGGSSAGGYLSMMLCFDARWLGAHGLRATDLAGFVHDAGQATRHYNVLREIGISTRRIIVDEAAPLYHIGVDETYPPMKFIVSDNDMPGRLEQTRLVLSTLKYFGHEDKTSLEIRHGGHCHYVGAVDEEGRSLLGMMVEDFIRSV